MMRIRVCHHVVWTRVGYNGAVARHFDFSHNTDFTQPDTQSMLERGWVAFANAGHA